MSFRPITKQEFFSRSQRDSHTGCLVWSGGMSSSGYGKQTFKGHTYTAHRLAWILTYGNIEKRWRFTHQCGNKLCINVEHMKLKRIA